MKKFLVVTLLMLSFAFTQAQSDGIDFSTDVETQISSADLPDGKRFTLLFVDTPIFAGVVTPKLIKQLPLGVPFVLSVDGKVTKYRLKRKN